MNYRKYHADNGAIILKVALYSDIKKWIIGKNAPNDQIVNNRKVNVPYELWGKQVTLTKKDGVTAIDGKFPSEYILTVTKAQAMQGFGKTWTPEQCTFDDVWESFKNRYQS
jgi:hypothetical protein